VVAGRRPGKLASGVDDLPKDLPGVVAEALARRRELRRKTLRSMSVAPNQASSDCIRRLRAAWDEFSVSAARVKFPSSATVRKSCSHFTSTPKPVIDLASVFTW
jgi:hypothetical protein